MSRKIEVVKEIRFAVVMYGGVSLAIYINGVAQELLRMVRATTLNRDSSGFRFADAGEQPNEDGQPNETKPLDEIEEIYRDLACILGDESLLTPELLDDYREWLRRRKENPAPPPRLKTIINEKRRSGEPIKIARFVVDILSGSSAGGINGVYLAKALVGGQQITKLEELWETEGDFAKLLCDEQSVYDVGNGKNGGAASKIELGLSVPAQAPSLLNSERMYLKLLTAFDKMDEFEKLPENYRGENAFVDEIDLFVTMTDYWGVPVPVRLFDQMIHERRHRQNVQFKFRKENGLNEFDKSNYPFLAFSARSTSSFPFAFAPMQGKKANEIIGNVKKKLGEKLPAGFTHDSISPDRWETAFSPATIQGDAGANIKINWENRVFVDGGYLDNKPFGYAIQALAQKQSNVLIERKLVYVEPEPDAEDYLNRATRNEPPFVLENTLAALTDLPRYETIREDLQQVLERNRLIVRVNQLVVNARKDELASLELSLNRLPNIAAQRRETLGSLDPALISANGEPTWKRLTLGELAQQKGQSVYSYYRLRISAVNDDLARMVTRRAGFDQDSIYFLGIRDLVRYWRKTNFGRGDEGATINPAAKSPLQFLSDFDYNYRLRRLRFVLQQADRLLQFEPDSVDELNRAQSLGDRLRQAQVTLTPEEVEALRERFPLVQPEVFSGDPDELPSRIILNAGKDERGQSIREFKKGVNAILQRLKIRLWEIDPDSNVRQTAGNELRFELERKVNAVKDLILRKNDNKTSALEELLGVKAGDLSDGRLGADFDLESRYRRAEKVIEDYKIADDLNEIGEIVQKIYNNPPQAEERQTPESLFAVARAETRQFLDSTVGSRLDQAVRRYLKHFYDNFDAYDQIIFPVTYQTPIGEAALCDVARISPLDATSLINETEQIEREKKSPKDENGDPTYKARRKVAGGVFRAFGAFFNENWRKNDILWGRLDAAERLLSIVFNETIVPADAPDKTGLHRSINDLRTALIEELHETMLRNSSLVNETYQKYLGEPAAAEFASLSDYVRQKYRVDRNLPEAGVFATTSRSLKILKQVLNAQEIDRLDAFKNVILQFLSLLYKPNREPGELRKFLKPYLRIPVIGVAVTTFLPLVLLVVALTFLNSQLPVWFTVAAAAVVLLSLVVLVAAYVAARRGWRQLQTFVNSLLWQNVTGEKRR